MIADVGHAHYGQLQIDGTTLNEPTSGPARCGIFAASSINNTRTETGGTYYGVMEMSGNLMERAVLVNDGPGRGFRGIHGDGILEPNGDANDDGDTIPDWPGTDAIGVGDRGGSWQSGTGHSLFVSRREIAPQENRINSNGFRAVRTAP